MESLETERKNSFASEEFKNRGTDNLGHEDQHNSFIDSLNVGKVLQRERRKQKLNIHDVSDATLISPRFIEALEKDDFTPLPSETYTIGFLRNYAKFLNIEPQYIIDIYRQQKIDLCEIPIKELTSPSKSSSVSPKNIMRKLSYALVIAAVVSAALYLPKLNFKSAQSWITQLFMHSGNPGTEAFCSTPQTNVQTLNLRQNASSISNQRLWIEPHNAFEINLEKGKLRICLETIGNSSVNGDVASLHGTSPDQQEQNAFFHLNLEHEGTYKNASFHSNARESSLLNDFFPQLENSAYILKFTPTSLDLVAESLGFEIEAIRQKQDQAQTIEDIPLNSNDRKEGKAEARSKFQDTTKSAYSHIELQPNIQVTLKFIGESYMEWNKDGQFYRALLVPKGELHTFEAENHLEIKLGNAGGVRILRKGQKAKLAGPRARIAKIEYRRIPDPLDRSITQIEEVIKIIQ